MKVPMARGVFVSSQVEAM